MKVFSRLITATFAVVFTLANGTSDAQTPTTRVSGSMNTSTALPPPLRWKSEGHPSSSISRLQFRELPLARIRDVEIKNGRRRTKPVQIGIARSTTMEATTKALPTLRWEAHRSGGSVARIHVQSPDALGLRVGLQLDSLPERVQLRFAGSDDPSHVVALVTGGEAVRLADKQRIYWTPGTDGDTQIIELYAPAGVAVSSIRLQVPQLSHLVGNSKNSFSLIKSIGDSGSCNIDAVCRVPTLGQHYVNAKNAVAHMVFVISGGSYICTGTLLGDTDTSTAVPYFYSAHHCISDGAVANTLNTYWGLEATSCGAGVSGPTAQLAGGATYLYSNATTDALLLRLNNAAPAGAYFAGWDAGPLAASSSVIAIHHPAGDLKKSSLGQQISTDASQVEVGWTSGTTEGGSSGSGLFTSNGSGYFLRGGLQGGSASCFNSGSLSNTSNRDYYSRFDVAYPNISSYLAPGGGGNPAPAASFNVAFSGLTASFTDTSTDTNGTIVSRSWNFGDGATSTATNPIRTYASTGTYNVRLTVTDNGGASNSITRAISVGGGATPALANGVAVTGLAGATASELRYTMSVPAGATNLVFTTSGGTGDVDLYIKYGAVPTTTTYDCRGFNSSNNENCTFPTPQAGTYHILLHSYANYSGATLKGSYVPSPPPTTPMATATRMPDFNGDGQSDILWRNGNTGANLIWRSAYSSANQPMTAVTAVWKIVGVGDFNGDGKDDVLWRNSNTGANAIWRSANSATPQSMTNVTNLAWKIVGIGDFNGDGKDDVLWRNTSTGANVIWRSANSATFQSMTGLSGPAWTFVGVGDFNGDGKDDVLWRNTSTGANVIWKSANSATPQSMTGVTDLAWKIAGVGDFNGDGKDDVVWRQSNTGTNAIWRSANSVTYQAMTAVTALVWQIVGVGDFNGDGKGDVLWRNSNTGANAIWKSANSATPQPVTSLPDLAWVVSPVR